MDNKTTSYALGITNSVEAGVTVFAKDASMQLELDDHYDDTRIIINFPNVEAFQQWLDGLAGVIVDIRGKAY